MAVDVDPMKVKLRRTRDTIPVMFWNKEKIKSKKSQKFKVKVTRSINERVLP